jgi:hypothetical protein
MGLDNSFEVLNTLNGRYCKVFILKVFRELLLSVYRVKIHPKNVTAKTSVGQVFRKQNLIT